MSNLSEEEKKEIEFLKSDKRMLEENYNFGKEAKARIASDIEKGLNIIEKQYKEIKQLRIAYKLMEKEALRDGKEELEIKDKMIDELIDTLNNIMTDRPASIFPYIFKDNRIDNKCIKCGLIENNPKTCKDCIKEYFRKKVESG